MRGCSRRSTRSQCGSKWLAAVATTTLAALASAAGVSFSNGTDEGIPLAGFAQLTLVFSLVTVGIAAVMARKARRPRPTFVRTAVALTVLSFVPDLTFGLDAGSAATLITLHTVAAAIVVPCLHAGVFLVPLAMRAFLPDGHSGAWLTIFTLETILYAVGTAFIVMLMVKDHHVHVYRTAASTDHLTGLLNRRAFMENAQTLRKRLAKRGESVAVLMFDLDHFKSVNDRFGHSAGDEVLRLFARVTKASTRLDDIIGRFGGEEFIAIVPGDIEVAEKIAGRVRTALENAGAVIESQPVGATVSIGAASSYDATMTVECREWT